MPRLPSSRCSSLFGLEDYLVEATFSPNLIMVAKRMTIGKLENSIGVEVLIATIMISSDSTILNVKRVQHECW